MADCRKRWKEPFAPHSMTMNPRMLGEMKPGDMTIDRGYTATAKALYYNNAGGRHWVATVIWRF